MEIRSISTDRAKPFDPREDRTGAFCRENHIALRGSGQGQLAGLDFAVKDAFEVEGSVAGFGHPDWLRTHAPATTTAVVVQQLLDAGAGMVGKTHCDELCYSLTGENVHYGTPLNTAAPDRVPGGSSCGSAAAVAAGLVDFALGTDCGGSIRIPASYCGLLGIRPTHGRVSLEGGLPFGPSFDVAGWFARDPATFERVASVLLANDNQPRHPRRLLMASDAWTLAEPDVVSALQPNAKRLAAIFERVETIRVSPNGLQEWFETFRVLQAAEIWQTLGGWITQTRPVLGPGVKERIEWAASVTPEMVAVANRKRDQIRDRVDDLLGNGDVLCLPTSPRPAPLKGSPVDRVEIAYRNQAMCLLCISGLCGLPQMSLPVAAIDGVPLGLSIMGHRGSDTMLLGLAGTIQVHGEGNDA